MSRRQYTHVKLTCNRGINQQRGKAAPEECADALNVWAPNGIVEQRPGYVGVISFMFPDIAEYTNSSCAQTFVKETTGGSTTSTTEGNVATLDAWAQNAFWYIGFHQASGDYGTKTGRKLLGFDVGDNVGNANGNNMRYEASYYNGTGFVPLRVVERSRIVDTLSRFGVSKHLSESDGMTFSFCPPGDWTAKAVASITRHYIRLKLKTGDGSATALDGTVRVTNHADANHIVSTSHNVMRGLFVGQFPSCKRYVAVGNSDVTSPSRVVWLLGKDHEFLDLIQPDSESIAYYDEMPATHAVVPQFGEGYIAFGGKIKRYSTIGSGAGVTWPHEADGVDAFAVDADVERRDFAVGDEAPFDPDYVVGLGGYPSGNIICYFDNRLWVTGSKDEPYTVKWSAAEPYQRVWPSTANDILMEDDNSPITGMAPLGEHMAVFKRDSVWLMVPVGENAVTQVVDYRARKIVDGVGCIAHHSIQQIMGRLIFLAEDGVYAFDGTANVQKLSDRITDTVQSISPGTSPYSVSAHWRTRNCYLLSVPAGGTRDNSKVLVYDYQNDTWWIWDIPIALFMNDEGKADEERLFFVDNDSCMHEMGVGNTDHGGAISSHILTQRLGSTDNIRRTLRQVEVISDNRTELLAVAVRANDDEANETTGSIGLTDDNEAKYADNLLYTVTTNYVLDRNRARRVSFRKQGDWLQVKVSHSKHNTPMVIRAIDVGFTKGTRR